MRLALVDSGLGLLPTAARLRQLRPDTDLVLALDPDAMPWGALPAATVMDRLLGSARAAAAGGVDALVVPCNTASTVALEVLRAEFEPRVPVIGTVPAVKPAAALGMPFAVWATPATTGSSYQRELVRRFAEGLAVEQVACPDLAEAIEIADSGRIAAAVERAAAATPRACAAVVLGCTHYPLVRDTIAAQLPGTVILLDSADAVARQTLRRLAVHPGHHGQGEGIGHGTGQGTGQTTVLLSGRPGELPRAAGAYAEGRTLLGSGLLG